MVTYCAIEFLVSQPYFGLDVGSHSCLLRTWGRNYTFGSVCHNSGFVKVYVSGGFGEGVIDIGMRYDLTEAIIGTLEIK